MKRLLGILNMNPEVDRNTWDHTEVRYTHLQKKI